MLFSPEDPEKTAKEATAAAEKTAGGAAEEEGDEGGEADEEAEADDKVEMPAWLTLLNPNSLVVEHAFVEPCLAKEAAPPNKVKDRLAFQFQRVGFFCVDDTSTTAKPVFNRIVALREDKEKKAIS